MEVGSKSMAERVLGVEEAEELHKWREEKEAEKQQGKK